MSPALLPPEPDQCRVASLLPAGTEIVCALGASHLLVGISHECDFPSTITDRPHLTWSPVRTSGSGAAIDAEVRRLHSEGRAVIAVDGAALHAVRPDLVLAQDLCEVCAVVEGDVRSLATAFDQPPAVLGLCARTLAGVFHDIRTVGAALGRDSAAVDLVASLLDRLERMPRRPAGKEVRVVVIEWLEPLYLAGHWTPELVAMAGGRDIGAAPGAHSVRSHWRDVFALAPDLAVVALCGFGLERALSEWRRFVESDTAEAASARDFRGPIWALDGNAYTSRPGPRVVEGAEILAHAIRGREAAGLVRLQ